MDDFYLIHPSKEHLKYCLLVLTEYLKTLDLDLNGKTQIFPFKNGVSYLGFHTYITESGEVVRKLLNSKKRNAQRKYLKMAKLVASGKIKRKKFDDSFNSWKNHVSHGNCKRLCLALKNIVKGVNVG